MRAAVIGVVIGGLAATAAQATLIEKACLTSGRASSRALCTCIQDAANLTLNGRDQKQAAEFFENPQRAQDMRRSNRASSEAFWERYESFIEAAEAFCDR